MNLKRIQYPEYPDSASKGIKEENSLLRHDIIN